MFTLAILKSRPGHSTPCRPLALPSARPRAAPSPPLRLVVYLVEHRRPANVVVPCAHRPSHRPLPLPMPRPPPCNSALTPRCAHALRGCTPAPLAGLHTPQSAALLPLSTTAVGPPSRTAFGLCSPPSHPIATTAVGRLTPPRHHCRRPAIVHRSRPPIPPHHHPRLPPHTPLPPRPSGAITLLPP